MKPELYIGLISGTSRDGLDAVVVDFEDPQPALLTARCVPYPRELAAALEALLASHSRPEPAACQDLDERLGLFFAAVAEAMVREAGYEARDFCAIGSHGQTVWHEPTGPDPVTMQLGSGSRLAQATGIPAVTDFRSADLLAGGQGAPLAPLLHRQLFARPGEHLAVLNLGGIANLSLLEADGRLTGFDTGPANCLMDLWIRQHRDLAFDAGGGWARSGRLLPELLAALLDEPYFTLPPPKSTGLETFNQRWLATRLQKLPAEADPADVQRTLLELSAATVAAGLQSASVRDMALPAELLVCGGGVHNDFLLERLAALLPGVRVASTASRGVHPDWIEATLFAWLARERLAGRALDTPPVTGARHPVQLGVVHWPDAEPGEPRRARC